MVEERKMPKFDVHRGTRFGSWKPVFNVVKKWLTATKASYLCQPNANDLRNETDHLDSFITTAWHFIQFTTSEFFPIIALYSNRFTRNIFRKKNGMINECSHFDFVQFHLNDNIITLSNWHMFHSCLSLFLSHCSISLHVWWNIFFDNYFLLATPAFQMKYFHVTCFFFSFILNGRKKALQKHTKYARKKSSQENLQ